MAFLFDKETLISELENYKSQLKQAKKTKAAIAVQFKHAQTGSELHSRLIAEMQGSSAEIKSIEGNLKATEKKIAQLTQESSQENTEEKQPPLLTIDLTASWNEKFVIRELDASEFNSWWKFIASMPNATAYHQHAWKEVIEQSFNNPTRIWVALDQNDSILGGLPLTFFSSQLFGKFAVSIPYVNYGGVITPYFNIAQQLLAYLPSLCRNENLSHIEIRTMQQDLATESSSKKASMILQLPNNSEELDSQLGAKVRAQVKKCEEHAPTIKFGKLDLLDDFYKVFAKNMRDLGTPVYAKTWFKNILMSDGINATLAVVYINNKPISTGFLVGFKNMLEIPWASTLKEANGLNANMWMYRKILDFAIEQKFDFFDFGRSTQDAGTYKFKKQWGSLPYPHYWYKILPEGSDSAPELNPDNPKFALMIAVWKRMPVWMSKIIGPPIIRNIP